MWAGIIGASSEWSEIDGFGRGDLTVQAGLGLGGARDAERPTGTGRVASCSVVLPS